MRRRRSKLQAPKLFNIKKLLADNIDGRLLLALVMHLMFVLLASGGSAQTKTSSPLLQQGERQAKRQRFTRVRLNLRLCPCQTLGKGGGERCCSFLSQYWQMGALKGD